MNLIPSVHKPTYIKNGVCKLDVEIDFCKFAFINFLGRFVPLASGARLNYALYVFEVNILLLVVQLE
jgi:hypothetical protein